MAVPQDVGWSRASGFALAVALTALSTPGSAFAATEIALRFHDDNAAARGPFLSPAAHAVIEKTAGIALLPRGRDSDGAFRFGFALDPTPVEVRAALNRLRATGAVVYADVAGDNGSASANVGHRIPSEPVTALIVRMQPSFTAKSAPPGDAKARLAAKSGLQFANARALADGSQLLTLVVPSASHAVEAIVRRLAADHEIAHVEVDRRAKAQVQPTDPMYSAQWNLTDPLGGIAAPRAWDITTGDPSAPIAVLDTGILPHPDIAARVIAGYDFVSDPRFSNDGDGRDADPTDPGDYVTAADLTPGSPLAGCLAANSSWHGTMVAGTLGAVVNNGNGVSGVNWTSPLLNVRVLGKCGGALSDVADGIRWAAGLPVPGVPANPKPARVLNLSFSGDGGCGPILQSAVTDAIANGAVLVAAAGNDSDDVANHWPASCSGVIAVAATSRNGSRAHYTNFGARIAVAAPGGGVGGSIPVLRNTGATSPDRHGYGYGEQLGSSLAAPHVSGIASLVLAVDRALTPAEVQAVIESSARGFPAGATDACTPTVCGAGIVDAADTLSRLAGNAPSPPATDPKPAPRPAPGPVAPAPPTPRIDVPPAGLAPVPGGWRAKSPAQLQRIQKANRPRLAPTPALAVRTPPSL